MSREISDLLAYLRGNEMALSRLYKQYADSFPEDADFWLGLSAEEISHAGDIEKLQQLLAEGKLFPGKTTLKSQAVKTNILYVNSIIEDCQAGRISKKKAYNLALDLENGLLEKRFFDVLNFSMAGTHVSIKTKLTIETEGHRTRIEEKAKSLL